MNLRCWMSKSFHFWEKKTNRNVGYVAWSVYNNYEIKSTAKIFYGHGMVRHVTKQSS